MFYTDPVALLEFVVFFPSFQGIFQVLLFSGFKKGVLHLPTRWAPLPNSGSEPATRLQEQAQQDPIDQEREEKQQKPVLASSSSCPDKAVSGGGMLPPPDDYKVHQELFKGMALNLGI